MSESDQDDDVFMPSDHKVAEIREYVADCDDKTELRRLKTVEIQGKDRKTAKQAVDDRLDALDGDDEDEDDAEDAGKDEAPEADAESEAEAADEQAVVDDADNTSTSDHSTAPEPASDKGSIVVRNPHKKTLHLQGLKGSLAPGETKEYPVGDRVKQYIREGELQVVTTR